MTADAFHLNTYADAGPAAVRAHLCAEHGTATWAALGRSAIDVPFPAEVHQLLHDPHSHLHEEAPA